MDLIQGLKHRDQYNIEEQARALGYAVTKAYTWRHMGFEMCADSTVCEYIPHIHGDSHIVVAE